MIYQSDQGCVNTIDSQISGQINVNIIYSMTYAFDYAFVLNCIAVEIKSVAELYDSFESGIKYYIDIRKQFHHTPIRPQNLTYTWKK